MIDRNGLYYRDTRRERREYPAWLIFIGYLLLLGTPLGLFWLMQVVWGTP